MDNNFYKKLVEDFKQLSHEDQYDKILVYLYAAQKSEENLIWLYLVIDNLGPDNIESNILIDLYDAFISIVEYGDEQKLTQVQSILSNLQQLKDKESLERKDEEKEADNLLEWMYI